MTNLVAFLPCLSVCAPGADEDALPDLRLQEGALVDRPSANHVGRELVPLYAEHLSILVKENPALMFEPKPA